MGLFDGGSNNEELVQRLQAVATHLDSIRSNINGADALLGVIHRDLTCIEEELQVANKQAIISNALKVLESQYTNRMFTVANVDEIEKYYNIVAENVLQDIKTLENNK